MAFLIPDNILNTLTCDVCNRYLSVKPIKVFSNYKTVCGRCKGLSGENWDGATSLYNVIGDKCLFKCINRFDGCRQLMAYSQTSEHEKTCIGKSYICPICDDCIATFRLIKHFQTKHPKSILKDSEIFFDLDLDIDTKTYIYQQEDNLFFLYFTASKFQNFIITNVSFVGNANTTTNIYQKICLYLNNKLIQTTTTKPCTMYGEQSNDCFKLNIPNELTTGLIKYHLSTCNTGLIPVSFNTELNGPTKSIKCRIRENPNFTAMVKQKCVRKIIIQNDFQEMCLPICLDINPKFSVTIPNATNFHCFNCQEIILVNIKGINLYQKIYFSNKYKHCICYCCFHMLKQKYEYIKYDYVEFIFSENVLNSIKLYCKWNCNTMLDIKTLLKHESGCHMQPVQKCPRIDCNYIGILDDVFFHIWCDYKYSRLHNSIIFISKKMKKQQKVCAFIQKKFLIIEITKNNDNVTIDVDFYEGHSNTEKLPLLLLFDESNERFLTAFEKTISVPDKNYWVKIIVGDN